MSVTPIIAKANSGSVDFELLPTGQYLARCYRIVDLGTHTETFAGQKFAAKPTRKVMVYFEVLQDYDTGEAVTMEDGRPFSISKKYTLSLHEKANFRKDLEKWRGVKFTKEEVEGFDITKLLGDFALIQVTHVQSTDGEKTYVNLDAIMGTKKTAEGVNELGAFSVDNPDQAMFDSFGEWLQTKINESDELKESPLVAGTRPEPAATPAAAPKKETTLNEELDSANL